MKMLLSILLLTLVPLTASADKKPVCEDKLTVAKKNNRSPAPYAHVAADIRKAYAEYVAQAEAKAQIQIMDQRDELATIQNANPQGFNTYAMLQREGMRVLVRSRLRLGEERRVRMLIGKLVTKTRRDYRQLADIANTRELALQGLLDAPADFQIHNDIDQLIRAIDDQSLALQRDIGSALWMYSGIISVLQEEAGLIPHASLLPDGLERALTDDLARAFLRPVPAQEQRAEAVEGISKETALRLLQVLRVVDTDGRTEISPSLRDFEELVTQSATLRSAKLAAEIKYERRQQRIQAFLKTVSDQTLMSAMSKALNGATLGRFQDFFDEARVSFEQKSNEAVQKGSIAEFLNLADRLPQSTENDNQLARAMITLLRSGKGLLANIATDVDAIEPLQRVKDSDLAKKTVWGPKAQTLTAAIEELEGQRVNGLTSALESSGRSHYLSIAGVSLFTYISVFQPWILDDVTGGKLSALKTAILGLVH